MNVSPEMQMARLKWFERTYKPMPAMPATGWTPETATAAMGLRELTPEGAQQRERLRTTGKIVNKQNDDSAHGQPPVFEDECDCDHGLGCDDICELCNYDVCEHGLGYDDICELCEEGVEEFE